MSGTIAMSGRRLALTVAWSRQARMPTMIESMSLTTVERASRAGYASAAAKTPDARSESARNAANAAHRPAALARRIAKAWPDLGGDERDEVREILGSLLAP